MQLYKSNMLAGLRCEKQLYLQMHSPELAKKTRSLAALTGVVVQEYARREFPDAIAVDRSAGGSLPFDQTARLFADRQTKVIFEAGIRNDQLAVYVDVLQRHGRGWDVIEIKSSASVKDHHIDDVTIQALALKRAGIRVQRYFLMHINSDFLYRGGDDYTNLFIREEVTEQVNSHLAFIEGQLDYLQAMIKGDVPERHVGSHCNKPYPCDFKDYCLSQGPDYPLAYLPNGWRITQRLIEQGIYDLRDIPLDELTSETQLRVCHVTRRGKPELLSGAEAELKSLAWPRYFLDFECIQFAIPIWLHTRPYMQLPFQWSCHVQKNQRSLTHHAFLDISGEDPRRAFAEALLTVCGDKGTIIVYHQSFEKRIISELAETFDDLADRLLALNGRVFDLLPFTKRYYYHPDMKGSWSIKNVLPCLVPELSYDNLDGVQNGTEAQAVYLKAIKEGLPDEEKRQYEKSLYEYCKLDTYAMVMIAEKLQGKG